MLKKTATILILFLSIFFIPMLACDSGSDSDNNDDGKSGAYMVGGQSIAESPPEESEVNSAPEISNFTLNPSTINSDESSQLSFKVSFSDNEGDVIKTLINFSSQPNKYYLYKTKDNTYGHNNYQLTITDTVSLTTAGTYTVKIAVQDEGGNTSNYLSKDLIVQGNEELTIWYKDNDEDGYGSKDTAQEAVAKPSGYVDNSEDCNDYDASINPGADEICDDGKDNDCDGDIDCDDSDCDSECNTCTDADGDGYYAESEFGTQVDCNDYDASINHGADEICDDGKDNDCDGDIDCDDSDCDSECNTCMDSDSDGYYAQSGCGTPVDCNDYDDSIHPNATEIPNDGKDNDCDGKIDNQDNSRFYGNYSVVVDIESCEHHEEDWTFGNDQSRSSWTYYYIPPNDNSDTASFDIADGDHITRTIKVAGDTIYVDIEGDSTGGPSHDWTVYMELNFSNNYNHISIRGNSSDNNPDECQGNITGNGIRQ